MDLTTLDDATPRARAPRIRRAHAVAPVGARTHWEVGGEPVPGAVEVHAPSGVAVYDPADLTVTVGAGTPVARAGGGARRSVGRSARSIRVRRRRPSAVSSRSGSRAIDASGTGRCATGCSRCASSPPTGGWCKGGGPTVKNVSGYDIPRLLVGSFGTLGVLVQVILRCQPVADVVEWSATDDDPFDVRRRTYRPSCIAWDGEHTHVLLEGVAADVARERQAAGAEPVAGRAPAARRAAPRPHLDRARRELAALAPALADTGVRWLAEVGVGTVHVAADNEAALAAARAAAARARRLAAAGGGCARPRRLRGAVAEPGDHAADPRRFDPEGKLNAGRFAFGPRATVEVDGQVDGETADV